VPERANLEIVREQFEATNRSDFASPMGDWAEDIQVVLKHNPRAGHGRSSPLSLKAGTYNGREAVGEFFADWFRTFRPVHFELLDIKGAGDAVAVAARHRARGRHSGVELSDDVFYEYHLREGEIMQIRFHDTWCDAIKAIGLPA
jgi:ketosteroid isomerase-like protein